jgi:hypothetical protein
MITFFLNRRRCELQESDQSVAPNYWHPYDRKLKHFWVIDSLLKQRLLGIPAHSEDEAMQFLRQYPPFLLQNI